MLDSADWTREKLLETSSAYWASCTLHAAVTLDVFTALGREGSTAAALARQLHLDERGLTNLLNALVALRLLSKETTRYVNTQTSSSYLDRSSADYQGYIIEHHHHLMEQWNRLDQAVRQGGPVRTRAEPSPDQRRSFLMGMFNLALPLARGTTPHVPLEGRETLLDLGGGPGTWAIHFCLSHPQVTATVYDLPATRPFAEQTVARFGMTERVGFCEGNFLEDPLGGPYDVAWLSHILHGEGPDNCRLIVGKAADCLAPGGLLLIHDFYLDDDGIGPLMPALFALNMLTGTPEGRSYSARTIQELMVEAGLTNIERLELHPPGPSSILVGRRG